MNISELFSQLNVETLKELAMKHNVQVGIKAPSQMLKAELVKSLSDHYVSLMGTDLIPIQPKPLKMKSTDIPRQFQAKKAKAEPVDDMQEWARQFIKVKTHPAELARQRRAELNEKYMTDKKLKEAIQKREARQAKAKQARIAKKEGTKKEDKEEKESKTEYTVAEKLILSSKKLLSDANKLINMEEGQKGKDLYSDIEERKEKIFDKIKQLKKDNKINDKEIASIRKNIEKVDKILEDEDVAEKFSF